MKHEKHRAEDRLIYAARRDEILGRTQRGSEQQRHELVLLEAWFDEIEPPPLKEWREAIVPIYEDPELLRVWKAFWELQPDRPLIIIPMGGAVRDRIPNTVKDAWFTRRGFQADSPEELFIRELWQVMEGVQSELESKSDKD